MVPDVTLLKKFESDFGTIRVTRSDYDGTLAYFQNGSFHSQANNQGVSVCAYIHVINQTLCQISAKNVLIIGCGGGTLATMLQRQGCKVTVVDINPVAFTIARRYFKLPSSVKCVCRDGIAYLRTTPQKFDAIVIDVFGPHNTVPGIFTRATFFQQVKNSLAPSGIMIMNVVTESNKDTRADVIARNAHKARLPIHMLGWPKERKHNTLIIGGLRRSLSKPTRYLPSWMRMDIFGLQVRGLRQK